MDYRSVVFRVVSTSKAIENTNKSYMKVGKIFDHFNVNIREFDHKL